MEYLKRKSEIVVLGTKRETVDRSGRTSYMRAQDIIQSGHFKEAQEPASEFECLNGTSQQSADTDPASTTD